jgi:hypothetical protein
MEERRGEEEEKEEGRGMPKMEEDGNWAILIGLNEADDAEGADAGNDDGGSSFLLMRIQHQLGRRLESV